MKNNKVCYILSYYSPNYIRTLSLLEALKKIDGIELLEARNSLLGQLRYFETIFKLITIRLRSNPTHYILGFRGHEIFWFVRLITIGKPLIFDQFVSPYSIFVQEKKDIRDVDSSARLTKKLISFQPLRKLLLTLGYNLERSILKYSNAILTDTDLHKEYYSDFFNIPEDKFTTIYVGTDETMFSSVNLKSQKKLKGKFLVFYYATFAPLHGIDFVLKAAKLVEDYPIKFIIIGGKGTDLTTFLAKFRSLKLKNVEHRPWIEYEKLPKLINKADLCLGGPFGNTEQGKRVITGKTYQFLAMKKPTVIGKINEHIGFSDRNNCLLVKQGDPVELAKVIKWAYQNKSQMSSIGKNGYELFQKKFSNEKIKEKLSKLINKL